MFKDPAEPMSISPVTLNDCNTFKCPLIVTLSIFTGQTIIALLPFATVKVPV